MRLHKRQVKIGSLPVVYWEAGSGCPIIILHGWGLSGRKYRRLILKLGANYHVLAIDLPGFGQTPLPPLTWGLPEYSQFIISLTKVLKLKKYVLVGHSFGGRVAIELASRRPKELNKLVLTGVPLTRMPKGFRLAFWLGAKLGKKLSTVFPFSLAAHQGRRWLYRLARANDYVKETSDRKQIFNKIIKTKQKKLLAKIKVPTLVVWGKKDRLTPLVNARQLKRGLANCQLLLIERAGHRLPYQKPTECARAIEEFCHD